MTKIVLDAEAFKALASDTRLQILKALDARPLTVSELARLLELNKATVFEHLKQLTVAELAKREDDPARKWVYYKLTWKGRNVLHPENAQIFIMLGLGALGVGGALLQTARILRFYLEGGQGSDSAASEPGNFQDASMERQGSPQPQAAGGSAPASSSSSAQADKASQTQTEQQASFAPVDEESPSGGGDNYLDSLQSSDFLIILAIVSFLGLLALLVTSLYGQQRRERRKILAQIQALPPGLNEAEERGV